MGWRDLVWAAAAFFRSVAKNSVFLLSKKLTLSEPGLVKQIVWGIKKTESRFAFLEMGRKRTPPDDDLETVRLSAARARAMDEAGAEIARQLNGPLTALLLYMGEIKQHSLQSRKPRETGFICSRLSRMPCSRPSASAP